MNTCSTCQYFHESSCHRYPPVVVGYVESKRDEYSQMSVETYTRSEFPNVLPTEWCGEWKSKPITEWTNKLSCNPPS